MKTQLDTSSDGAEEFESRLQAQAELIDTLQRDLENVKDARRHLKEKAEELEKAQEYTALQAQISERNERVALLESELEEIRQQDDAASEERAAEIESLKEKVESDRDEFAALKEEINRLRDKATEAERHEQDDYALTVELEEKSSELKQLHAELERLRPMEPRLHERDDSIAKLIQAIKKHERTIQGMKKYIQDWKDKYTNLEEEFLVTDGTVPCLPSLPETGRHQAVDEQATDEIVEAEKVSVDNKTPADGIAEHIEPPPESPESPAAASGEPRAAYTYVKD